MRNLALVVAGLAALTNALPTGGDAAVDKRQGPTLGEPTVTFDPSPSRERKPVPIPFPFQWPPSEEQPAPTFTIGRRGGGRPGHSDIDSLAEAFAKLAAQYTHKHPPLTTFLILEHMAALLAAAGHPGHKNIIFLGPAETHFQIATKAKRQDGVFGIGGGCAVDDVISLLLTYSSLQAIYGSNPPTQIKNLKEAIYAALRYCNMDPEVGGMIPERPRPGGPMVPEKPVPGAPMVPERPAPGAPMVPEKPVQGAPLVPEKPVQGAPLVPEKPATGAPMVPERTTEGAPLVPSS